MGKSTKHNRGFNNLTEVLAAQAKNLPDKPFIIFGRKRLSFSQLDNLSSYFASFLHKSGVKKGQTVCLWMYNCPEFVISYFAVLKLGGIVVPVNNLFKREEAKYIVEDSQSKILICSPEKIEDSLNIHLRVKDLKKVISFSFSKELYKDVLDFNEILRKQDFFGDGVKIDSCDIAEILYTSGTTGKPKGACLTHGNLISNVADCKAAIEARPRDTFICLLPLFHSFASTVCMLFPLYVGSSTVIFRAVRPFKRILRSIRKNRITIFVGVPSIFSVLKDIKLPWILRSPLIRLFNPVRLCISGSAALPKEIIPVFERRLRTPLLEGYGLTETSPVVTLNPLRGKRKAGSIGVAFPSVEVKVVDSKGGELAPGQIGELLVRGPNVMKGYFRMEQESKEVIVDGWLHTGDLARIDEEGYVYIVGRIKEMINVRGLNVYPKEIEELLYRLPYIKEAAVVGINHPRKGEVPIGFIVPNDGISVESGDILRFLRDRLAAFKVPLKIEVREVLPKSATGKVLKYVLKEEIEKRLFPDVKNS